MKKFASLGTFGLIVVGFQSLPAAGQEGIAGEWILSIDQGRGPMMGLLELVDEGGRLIGHVEGGPIAVNLEGNRVELGIDDRTGAGEPYVRTLVGELNGDVMEGRFGPEEPSQFCRNFPLSCHEPAGTWKAERIVDTPPPEQAPRPVDFSGIWVTAPGGGGIARYTMDLTPAAQAWVDDFDTELDLPSQRLRLLRPLQAIHVQYRNHEGRFALHVSVFGGGSPPHLYRRQDTAGVAVPDTPGIFGRDMGGQYIGGQDHASSAHGPGIPG